MKTRDEKLKEIIALIDEWENVCAGEVEQAQKAAIQIAKEEKFSPAWFNAAARGAEYIKKMEDQREVIARKILEIAEAV